jgi:hypothetical protein
LVSIKIIYAGTKLKKFYTISLLSKTNHYYYLKQLIIVFFMTWASLLNLKVSINAKFITIKFKRNFSLIIINKNRKKLKINRIYWDSIKRIKVKTFKKKILIIKIFKQRFSIIKMKLILLIVFFVMIMLICDLKKPFFRKLGNQYLVMFINANFSLIKPFSF